MELNWIYRNIKKNIIQLNFSGFGLQVAPLLTSLPLMEDDWLSNAYCWVLSCQCDPARAPQGPVCRPWLLYTVQSNFAFKLFEFFSVSNYPPPKSTMTLAFNFSRFVFTLFLLLTFFIWLWHVWTGFYFDLLYFEFRTSKQCVLEPCKCHELNFSGLLLLFSFFSRFSSDYGIFGQVFLPSQQRGLESSIC